MEGRTVAWVGPAAEAPAADARLDVGGPGEGPAEAGPAQRTVGERGRVDEERPVLVGEDEDVIRVGFIYDPSTVAPLASMASMAA